MGEREDENRARENRLTCRQSGESGERNPRNVCIVDVDS